MNNLVLISGEDEFQISQELEKIQSKYDNLEKGVNFLLFDKDNLEYLGNELSTYSFFNAPKLIVVKVPKGSKKEQEQQEEQNEAETVEVKSLAWLTDELKEQILNMLENIELIFVEIGKPKTTLLKFVQENGKTIDCNKNNKSIATINSIIDYAKNKSLKISREDANYLLQCLAGDTRSAFNSIDILQDYLESDIINRIAIDDICVKSSETIIFNLIDNMGDKKTELALKNLDDLLNSNEPIQKILIMLTRHFKSLLITKECIERKLSVEKELSIKSSYTADKYKRQSGHFTKEELIRIFKNLYNLDVELKQQPIDVKIALQKIIMM